MPPDGVPAGPPPEDSDRLACGKPVDDLLAQVTDGAPPRDPEHQRGCPHCRAALAELEDLWAPVRDLAAEHVRAPAGLLQAVMAQIRELSRNAWQAVLHDPVGQTRIAARVVGAVARLAAESVPHVTLALGGGHAAGPMEATADPARVAGPEGEAATDIGVAGTHVVIDVQIAVDFGVPIPQVADQVRRRVAHHIATHTGLTTTEVNVTVVDVRQPPADH
ncbi:Asp23/Gls24 family envelope stress response protein [Geodermatophilus sp. DF01-2]|uniref:Asp23/Gls24 family envelope stress response protein n=1 Tax=Geodermatophilus sp. DF01-2 TaxID=2559610 RepID=UPI0010747F15|nr:Asp23/Gls24 family envelope stress response protein [Geodermatophilus sp. DF01_2]TFV64132.1 Asp23/Gls24 family envelope stress response protein [Geodermatophilus sp. DF01_2]